MNPVLSVTQLLSMYPTVNHLCLLLSCFCSHSFALPCPLLNLTVSIFTLLPFASHVPESRALLPADESGSTALLSPSYWP